VPEFRRIGLTWLLTATVVALFLWMVGKVLIAGILAIIIASYLRPLYMVFLRRVKRPMLSAVLTLLVVIIPVLGALVYSYTELVDVLGYISTHQSEVAGQIDASIRRLPYLGTVNATENIRRYVLFVSDYGTKIPAAIKEAVVDLSVAVVIGTAFTGLVTKFTDSIIQPLINRIGAGAQSDYGILRINIGGGQTIDLNVVLSAAINFVLVAAVVYFLVVAPYNRLRKKGEVEQAQDTELAILTEIRNILAETNGQVGKHVSGPGTGPSPDTAKTTSADRSDKS